jgi:hypothetical protein
MLEEMVVLAFLTISYQHLWTTWTVLSVASEANSLVKQFISVSISSTNLNLTAEEGEYYRSVQVYCLQTCAWADKVRKIGSYV